MSANDYSIESTKETGGVAEENRIMPPKSTNLVEDVTMQKILHSDKGVSLLLARLKRSIVSGKECLSFLKKKVSTEESYASDMRKLYRNTKEAIAKPEGRKDSFSSQFEQLIRIEERRADASNRFVAGVQTIFDELAEVIRNIEKSRKVVKESNLRNEKLVQDAEQAMEKAKSKLLSLREDLDRSRSGDPRKGFLRGAKAGPQHEEELMRKITTAETEYNQKVQTAQKLRGQLLNALRPDAVRQLKDLIAECDAAMTLQLQRYAGLCEAKALNDGLAVSPIKTETSTALTARETIALIDNELDLYNYVLQSINSRPVTRAQLESQNGVQANTTASANAAIGTTPGVRTSEAPSENTVTGSSEQVPGQSSITSAGPGPGPGPTSANTLQSSSEYLSNEETSQAMEITNSNLPPGVPPAVFGTPIGDLLDYEGGMVPYVVYHCIRAVDEFGLDSEGIYRINGDVAKIQALKQKFNVPWSQPGEFSSPDDYFNDINNVSGLLKQYFREIPDPLLTNELYSAFIEGSKIQNETQRRDAIHTEVNKLPDPNYTTLRYLCFHLYRVQEHETQNRMSAYNLGVVWGPTLMGTAGGAEDMPSTSQVIETILTNCYVIFNAD
ncbi:hypothetical protein CANCADRAFT_998 [Tortispora caseinolytica NRRL Y-17796]|uniref:Rho-GAP domain-containing protein n=1 Tax=Tortispora caseinolytica NRRL Y-17796 TaxID=767744 RepID=A0A1E4TKX8_9ASCO|nr:hypothetical protein CANCADRAFT_998 [Tortispora caseinolytica NRRL Y-17796]